MRIPSFSQARTLLVLALLAGAVALISAPKQQQFTIHEKAYYADQNMVNFVRPGLAVKLLAGAVAADGTVTAKVSITDPKGVPLDKDGITTPGVVALSFIAATIPKGQRQYTAYTTRIQTSPITKNSATQAGADSGGTFAKTGDGQYTYTFRTKAPAGFDATATHTIGVYASRTLTDYDLGTQYDSDTLTFVPNGAAVTVVRDVIKTQSCDKCHDQLSFHGGSRRGIEMCVLCHTPQTVDPDTGNTMDLPVMTHKIHAGSVLPTVQAGGHYQIIGFNQAVSDFSSVVFPADVRRCTFCHEQNTGAAQATAYLTPNQAACGACHDDVNFVTGKNHSSANVPQASDKDCATCHTPQGDVEFDASIVGAHTIPTESLTRPGVVVDILRVDNGSAGQSPTVTFTLRDNSGAGIPLSQMTASPNRVALVMAGPTTDYGATSFGAATPGYVSENPVPTGKCSGDGTCTYTFNAKIPANATGTYSIGIEARRGITLLPGTDKQQSSEYGAKNKVVNFSVDGSPVTPRRTVVAIDKCNQCHSNLSLHGENRNQIEQCVMCHNPSENDSSVRPVAVNAADKKLPPQSVNFALMIHSIHTGENMAAQNRTYVIVGFGGSHNDFSEVRYPAFSLTGSAGDTRNCDMCHVNGSQNLPLQDGLNQVISPQGLISPMGAATAACTACHGTDTAASHALANTTVLGESCEICHGQTAEFSVGKVHAQ